MISCDKLVDHMLYCRVIAAEVPLLTSFKVGKEGTGPDGADPHLAPDQDL